MSQSQDYLEAVAIMSGASAMLVELRHLEAMDEHYQCEIIRMAYDMNKVTEEALKRN